MQRQLAVARDRVQPSVRHVTQASYRLLLRWRKRFSRGSISEQMPFLLHRRERGLRSRTEVTAGASADDRVLVERIMTAYRRATSSFAWDSSSMWKGFFEQHHAGIHQALIEGDLETTPAADLPATRIWKTFLDGREAHDAGTVASA